MESEPLPFCIYFLARNPFIRNFPPHQFESYPEIHSYEHIFYCVGLIGKQRYVHSIKILKKTPKPGITSYLIEWYLTAIYSHLDLYDIPKSFQSFRFWVHSGVALRKNFFLFDDRMSLIRSSFLFDRGTKKFFRMTSLLPYLLIPEEIPMQEKIFSSKDKYYHCQKRVRKRKYDENYKKKCDFHRSLKKFLNANNHHNFLEQTYPKLFQEAHFIISQNNGGSS